MSRGPKTLGGWVVVNHGIRKWWHCQRVLLAWGLCREMEGRPVLVTEVAHFDTSPASFYRALGVWREVFGELSPGDVWEKIRTGRGVVADAVMSAPASVVGVS